jgi:predicted membrane-bound spermidine synthase
MTTQDRAPAFVGPLALFLFALSGAAGLIYQSIWAQYLGLFLGHAAYAQSLVLAIFMGGMAVGAWWASAHAIHWRNLLRAYAWVELTIGLAAAVFDPVYLAVTGFAYEYAFPALASGTGAQLFKWFCAALLIFPQAALLGSTFPLMSNSLMRRLRVGNGAILGGLYFTNSIGAAVGALVATFVLLPAVGLPGAMRFGALLNLFVAAIAFLLSRASAPSEMAAAVGLSNRSSVSGQTLLLGAAFVTGATSFVYEIGWVRMLSLAFGSTVHAFELMLAAFIGGLAFGGLWIRSRIDGYAQPVRVAGYVQVLMGLAALVSLILYNHSFDWVEWLMAALPRSNSGYSLFNVATASTAVLIMAPTAFFAGMTLPLFTLALLRNSGAEASVGRVYAANTVGAIVGVFAALHLLVPGLGLKLTMIAAAAGDLVLGLVLLRRTSEKERNGTYLAAIAVCGVALAATLQLARFDPMAMSGGVYRTGRARVDSSEARVVFYRDGKTASVASSVIADGRASIATNGKTDASIQMVEGLPPAADEVTMIMLAMVPLALHPNPRDAAVIGFGSGMSTHTLLGDSRLQRVDTVEIEPAMYEGAKVFGKFVERAYRDPRSHVHFDDAKSYFAANKSRYDIIISEPSNPWVSGVANLFSVEFYRFIPHHLNRGGLFVQWIQQYEINDELVATVVRALSETFTDFRIYLSDNSDMLIVASADGPLGAINDEVFRQPGLHAELERVGLATSADLGAHQIGDRRSLLPLFNVMSNRMNSDFHPILSLEAPRARFTNGSAQALIELSTADLPMREVMSALPRIDPSSTVINPDYSATLIAHHALQIAIAMRESAALYLGNDASTAKAIAFARANVGQCHAAGNGTEEIDSLIQLAGQTIPYLDAAQLQGVWISPRWIDCTNQAEPVRSILALLDTLARRDFASAGTQAGALLETHKNILSPTARDWLLRATMLSAIAQGDYAQVSKIDASVGADIAPTPATLLQREYLLAFADARLYAEKVPAKSFERSATKPN